MQEEKELPVRSLGWEDPLEEEIAIHSRILAWRIPWTEEPGRLQSMRLQRVRHDRATEPVHTHTQNTGDNKPGSGEGEKPVASKKNPQLILMAIKS